jgi:choline-sulfatase
MRLWRERRGVDKLTREEARRARAAYYGLVTLLDEQVGRILGALQDAGLAGDTAIAYTSDHGEMAGEHGMWWKMSFYEGSAGVPLIWSWPGHFAEGQVAPAVTSLLDVGPTLIDLAGAPVLPHAWGRSLAGWLAGGTVEGWPDEAFCEMPPDTGARGAEATPPARMVRRGPWKLSHFHGYETPQLFHLGDDSGEWHDRGAEPACAAIRDELLDRVRAGWSGEAILDAIAGRGPDLAVLSSWYRAVQPPKVDAWTMRPEHNVFPEA